MLCGPGVWEAALVNCFAATVTSRVRRFRFQVPTCRSTVENGLTFKAYTETIIGARMAPTTTRSSLRTKGHLLRILGVGFGIAVIVGGAIGSGILRTPGLVAAQLRSPGIIIAVWLVGGIYAFCCTLSVIELGTMLPRAGGWYVYSRRAFGEYGGFLVGCIDWIAQPVAIAYLAVAFGDFAAELQPSLRVYVKVVSFACVIVLALLNWFGLRAGSRMQELTSLIKALALVA